MPDDTIHAVSSGRPPAAIAVMRISGPHAGTVLAALAGPLPEPRLASLRTVRSMAGEPLDRALVLWFPGPASATGEDVAEIHLHGGIAIVDAVSRALTEAGARPATAGEFTRRAVLNGRLDLNEAEALADLLAAETATQRREAMLRAGGAIGRELAGWTARLLDLAAAVERAIDHEDEDAAAGPPDFARALAVLRRDILAVLDRPAAERLRDGIRVAIVGPVNAGKSTLFNALVGSEAAIVSDVAGTTRDAIERPVVLGDIAFVLIDTAGVRETADPIERIGVERARSARADADIVIDLAGDSRADTRCIAVAAKSDLMPPRAGAIAVSARSGSGLRTLIAALTDRARALLPDDGEIALSRRHRDGLSDVVAALAAAEAEGDPLLVAEHIARARRVLDRLTGQGDVEDLLDTLFARFCLGK